MTDGGESGEVREWRITTCATPAQRRANVAYALSLGLPELLPAAPRLPLEIASVMATGVSFEDSPVGLPNTIACNGALGLMLARGEVPTWWVAVDPQALVADFLEGDLPTETTYLVASTCHPAVFDRLRDRDVRIWHASDDDATQGYADLIEGREASTVTRLSSVTLSAIEIAAFGLGFALTETWGWEGCFRGRRHHATGQYDNRDVVTIDVDGVTIPTSRVWIYEMYGALGLLKSFPRPLTVHGDGLFARAISAAAKQPETVQ